MMDLLGWRRSTPKALPSRKVFWWLSLAVATFFGLQSIQYAFSSQYIVQDDVRQHGFWMQRFLDPQLFPDDLIADYFQSAASPGYTAFYRLMAGLGIGPLWLSKILPLVLGLITTGYSFGVCLQMLPIPVAGFISTLLLNQSLWLEDDLVSATPRAFLYPLFSAFLYYLLRNSLPGVGVAIALMGLFYPPFALLAVAILSLRLLRWQGFYPQLVKHRWDYWFWGVGVAVTALVLLPYELAPSEFGPLTTAAQARTQPEFHQVAGAYGRAFFFHDNPFIYWLFGPRSGALFLLMPPLIWAGFALPFWLRQPDQFPLARQVRHANLLLQITGASFGLFFVAHALLFRLHLPSRYTYHSLRIVMAFAAGIALTLWGDRLRTQQQWQTHLTGRQLLSWGLKILLVGVLAIAPFFPQLSLPTQLQIVGRAPRLYEFLSQQPKDTLIASVAEEVNNLPSFAARSILVGREYALPYHTRYYTELRQRTIDLIEAQYSPDLTQVQRFIQKYGVNFFLLDLGAFTPAYVAAHEWMSQFQPTTASALTQLQQGKVPALAKLTDRCQALEIQGLILVNARCISSTKLSS